MSENARKRRISITTRTGDAGETSLLYGERVSKTHPQVEACGAVDELNAQLGMAKATTLIEERRALLESIQRDLIALMGEVAVPSPDLERYNESGLPQMDESHLQNLDGQVDKLESEENQVDGWALPGANLHAAALDLARTMARRAERRVVGLHHNQIPVRPLLHKYLNRLSDLLWLLARKAENESN